MMSEPSTEYRSRQRFGFANIVLSGGAGMCFFVVTYFIYYYAWTQERYFTSQVGIFFYYVCPIALFVLLIALLRLRPAYKANVALVLCSILVSVSASELFLLVFELSTRLEGEIEDAKQTAGLARKFGVEFDIRNKREMIADLGRNGIEAYPVITARMLLQPQPDGTMKSAISIDGAEVLPLGGIADTVTVMCNETGEYTIYESDEHGFHNPRGMWATSRVDAAAVGDSFTHGACVRSDENFVALIRRQYPRTLNLGAVASGPLLMLAAIKEYAQFFEPKVVFWFYFEGNDLDEIRIEQKSPLLMRYLAGNFEQGLRRRQGAVDRALAAHVHQSEAAFATHGGPARDGRKFLRRLESTLKLNRLRQRLGLAYGDIRPDRVNEEQEATLALFRNVLLAADESVRGWGGTFYFVYLPEWHRYGNPPNANRDRNRVLKLVKTLGLPLIDIHEAFLAHGDPLGLFPFRRLYHYNAEGQRAVAEAVLRSIIPGVNRARPSAATVMSRMPGQPEHD